MQRKSSRTNGAVRRLGQQSKQLALAHPPQFQSTKKFVGRARYLALAANNIPLSITRRILLNHLIMNTTATTNYRLLSGIRLKSVSIWQSGSTSPISVEWTSQYGPSSIVSDTAVGTAQPAYVSTSPPPMSLASFWSITGQNETEVIAILSYVTNAVIDITYEAVLQNGETPTSVTTTANGTTGTVYMTYLDGVTKTDLIPQSYASLT